MGRHGQHHDDRDRFEGRGGFGVRRPLRFLTVELGLDQKQVAAFARILDDLKIERAQGEVDDRRAMAEYADSMTGAEFDAARANAAGDRRIHSATQLRDTLVRSLGQMHAMLSPEQRERLAYLIRAGVLAV